MYKYIMTFNDLTCCVALVQETWQNILVTQMFITPPLKKVQEPKKVSELLTLISGVIYQANQELGGP